MTSDKGRKTRRRRNRKENEKREEKGGGGSGAMKRKNASGGSGLTTRIIPMQLYNYNTLVHQADAINKGDKQGAHFRLRLITGYDNLRIRYIRRERPAAVGPSSDSERGQSGNLNGRIVEK